MGPSAGHTAAVESVAPFLLMGVLLLGGVAGFLLQARATRLRQQELAAFAAARGWTWTARDDAWCRTFTGEPFGVGDSRRADNVLQGEHRGRPCVAFDYTYKTHSTDSKGNRRTTTHRYGVAAIRLPASLPPLTIGRENLLTRLAGAVGFDDVELESEDFNRAFRVGASDRKFAYDVLHPRTMEMLLARDPEPMWLAGFDAVAYGKGRHTTAEVLERVDTLVQLVDAIPDFVWVDRGEAPRPRPAPPVVPPAAPGGPVP